MQKLILKEATYIEVNKEQKPEERIAVFESY